MYAEGCTAQCTFADCNTHGRCLGDGSCECFGGWSGDHCLTRDGDGGVDPCVKDQYGGSCNSVSVNTAVTTTVNPKTCTLYPVSLNPIPYFPKH
jgi:hypothetical protein